MFGIFGILVGLLVSGGKPSETHSICISILLVPLVIYSGLGTALHAWMLSLVSGNS